MDQSELFRGARYVRDISSDSAPFATDLESPRTKCEGKDGRASDGKVHDMQIWTRHLTLYAILGNLGMLFTATSSNTGGVLSAAFCIGTYGHVFMEGSVLLRLLTTKNRFKLQQLHGVWGMVTIVNLAFFSESVGQLLWAAESILTDSMSLLAGFYLMQADVDKQIKYLGLSHFIHGITFELFLWCDVAGLNANGKTERGVWWVLLVVANAACQIAFHCPVIRGKVAVNPNKPQTPSYRNLRYLLLFWLIHNMFAIPTVLSLSTAAGNYFYLTTWVTAFYLKMIYVVPMVTLLYSLACFVDNDTTANCTTLWSELGFQETARFSPSTYEHNDRGYSEEMESKTYPHHGRNVSVGDPRTDLRVMHSMEQNEVRKFSSLFPVYQMLLGISFLLLATWDLTEITDTAERDKSSLMLNILPLPLATCMVVSGLLGSLHGAGVVTPRCWNRSGSAWYIMLTSLSLLLLCTTGLLQWLHIHELHRTSTITAEVGLVCGLLYILWGATVLYDRLQEMVMQCVLRKN